MINISASFAETFPCIYSGKYPCSHCIAQKNPDDCDMKQGRELHESMFIRGYKQALMDTGELIDMGD